MIKKEFKYKYTNLLENKINNLEENNKLYLFKQVKLSLDEEFYLTNEDLNIRQCFTKLRISDHNLEIERGRYYKIPRQERLCKICNVIENEEHFVLHCKINKKIRDDLFKTLENENEKFKNMDNDKKLVYLLNPTSYKHVKIIGSYLKRSLELRTEVS